jgi:hypothetical protein
MLEIQKNLMTTDPMHVCTAIYNTNFIPRAAMFYNALIRQRPILDTILLSLSF